jgi:3-phenylpropionate/trans-cinnamate dioxygenase ferredoxin subunit
MRFIKLEKLLNLYDGYQQCFDINGSSFLLIQVNNKNHLYLNICPHKQQTLGNQCLQNEIIRCPWHGLIFQASNGACLQQSNTHLKLSEYKLAFEGIYIGVYID